MNKNKICQKDFERKLKLQDIWNITNKYGKLFEKNIRKGNIKVNNKKKKSSYQLKYKDLIIIHNINFA